MREWSEQRGRGRGEEEKKRRREESRREEEEEVLCDLTQTFLPGFFFPLVRDRQLPILCTVPAKQHQNCTRLFLELIFCF